MAGKGFVFLESYYEAAKDLPDKQRLALYDAIIKYALKSEETNLTGVTKSLFVLIQPVIDKSAKRAKAGSKGGASKKDICLPEIEQKNSKQTASKTQAKPKKMVSKAQSSAEQNASDYIMDHYPTDNEDLSPTEIVDKDPATQEDDDFASQKEKEIPPKSPRGESDEILKKYSFSENMSQAISRWLAYKRERRETYKPTGLSMLLTMISEKTTMYPESEIISLVDESMANGWRGIAWDRLRKKPNAKPPEKPPESRWDYL